MIRQQSMMSPIVETTPPASIKMTELDTKHNLYSYSITKEFRQVSTNFAMLLWGWLDLVE